MRIRFAAAALCAGIVVPTVAAEIPLADFAREPQFRNVKISPDGEYLAAASTLKDHTVLSLMKLSDFSGHNLRVDDHSEVAGFWWVGPQQVMYSIAERTARQEAPLATGELYVADADGSHHHVLVGGAPPGGGAYEFAHLLAILPDDPAHVLVSRYAWINAGSADSVDAAYRVDLRRGGSSLVAKAPIRNAHFLADHKGVVRICWGEGTDWRNHVFYRADADAEWEPIADEAHDGHRFLPRAFDRTDENVYVECDGKNGVGGVCRWNVAQRSSSVVWSGTESGPDDLIATTDGKDIFAVASLPDRPHIDLLDAAAPEAALLRTLYARFPGQRVTLGAATRDGSKRIAIVDSDVTPGDFYLYDRDKKGLARVLSRMPWIKPETLAPMQPIKLAARDGLPLHGYLTRPLGKEQAKGLPLVVYVHGGPFGVRDEWGFDAEVQLLANRGYAVLQVNFRGSGGYGAAFEAAGHREWGGKMQDDLTDATRWAIAQGIADPKRICIYGASYGGYAALEGAVKEPDLYACAIGFAGVYDLPAWAERTDVRESRAGRSYIRDAIGADASDLRARSPIAHLDRLKAKVMLIVGGADRRVPPAQGEALHAALDARKIAHEWLYRADEGHGFYDRDHRVDLYARLLAFLDGAIGAQALAPHAP